MPAVLDNPGRATFDRADVERAWQLDTPQSRRVRVTPETAILVRRNSPHDFQDREIYLWIDEEPLGKIRYGEAVNQPVQPGRHTIRVFNTLLTRTLTIDAAPGEQVRLQCGTGMPAAGWLMMMVSSRDLLARLARARVGTWTNRASSSRSTRNAPDDVQDAGFASTSPRVPKRF